MESCFKYSFKIVEPLSLERDSEVSVMRSGSFHHDGKDIQRRFITGEKRAFYEKEIIEKKKAPSTVAGESLSKISDHVAESGNRNDAPDVTLLYNIGYEARKRYDLDNDFHTFLCKLKLLYDQDQNLNGTHISGFIQGYSLFPEFS